MAGIHTWSGNGRDDFWSNPANWTTSPPLSGETDLILIFPPDTPATQDAINDIPGLVVTSLTLSGHGYRLSALTEQAQLTLAAGATLTCSGSNNLVLSSLVLKVENGIANLAINGTAEFRIQSAILGPGSITKSGTGTLRLEGLNSNTIPQFFATGGVTIFAKPAGINAIGGNVEIHPAATVQITSSNQIPDTAEVVMHASGLAALPAFDLNGNHESLGAVSGTGVLQLGNGLLILDQPTGTSRAFSGPIHGAGGTILKRGQGVLSLNYSLIPGAGAVSTYSGATYVEAGELYFNRSAPFTWIRVPGSALVGGTRTPGVVGAPVPAVGPVVMIDGVFAPGSHLLGLSDPLTSAGLNLSGSTRFHARLQSHSIYSRVNVIGSVALQQPVLDISVSFTPAAGTEFPLISNDNTDPVYGYFAGLPEGAAISADGVKYRISYQGGDGNDVTLTRVGVELPPTPPVLLTSLQPEFEGGQTGFNLLSSTRAAERYNVEATDDLTDPLGWEWLGEIQADEFGDLRFFDADGANGNRFYRFARSIYSPVLIPLPGTNGIPISNLPTQTVAAARQYLQIFGPDSGTPPGSDAADWSDVDLAPAATLVFDPLHANGTQPAYAELKVVPNGQPNGPSKGYILISLTDNDAPIVEFATRGSTKTERVLKRVGSGAPAKILRFNAVYWSVEDAGGHLLGQYGTPPGALADNSPRPDLSGHFSFDSTTGQKVLTALPPLEPAPLYLYPAMKQNFLTNPLVASYRLNRSQIASGRWSLLRGGRLPRLSVGEGESTVFLQSTPLKRVSLLSEDGEPPIAQLQLLAGSGGFSATGLAEGSAIVRVVTAAGAAQNYTLVVTSATPAAFGAAAGCPSLDTDTWYAGTGWDGDQRLFHQLKDNNKWCPSVGCGPTALAMLLGWWDVNGVPSAFYKLNSGRGNAAVFRFNPDSLKNSDAPKTSWENESLVRAVYDDLHGLCNTFCVSGQGATAPDQMASAFYEYIFRVANSLGGFPWPAPMNEFGPYFVECHAEAHWNDFFLVGGTDWEEGGKAVANGIKNNRPGVVGIWSGITPHYALAYGYKRVERYEDCEQVELTRWFKCNMGWGDDDPPEWHDAEAVWFGLTASMTQVRTPDVPSNFPSVQLLPYIFNADLDPARCAAVMDDSGNRLDIFSVFDRKLPGSLERIHSPNAGNTWFFGYDPALASGIFRSSPAATVSIAGSTIDLFARGMDKKIWRARSLNGGTNFSSWSPLSHSGGIVTLEFASAPAVAGSANAQLLHVVARHQDGSYRHTRLVSGASHWTPFSTIPFGAFNSAPAAACSGDGQKVFVFGRGTDNRIWWNYSSNAGTNWTGWAAMHSGTFSSAPAAAASADGNVVHVVGRGMDNRYWHTALVSLGGPYAAAEWKAIGSGVFSSGPAVVCTGDGAQVHVFGRGTPPPPPPPNTLPDPSQPRLWRAYSGTYGNGWQLAWDDIQPFWE